LAEWIVDVAEWHGWRAQMTSVPGVAQRTGTTVYYLETCPPPSVGTPIFALMPVPGDVDIVVAAELMEAGRAAVRGFVSPDRTTIVASSHRVFGITEKSALGNGIADESAVLAALKAEARRLVCFDMDEVCTETRSVISSVLFGALAASGALPFSRDAYESAIRKGGVAVGPSLKGFAMGFERAMQHAPAASVVRAGPPATSEAGRRLDGNIRSNFPAHLHGLIVEGVRRLMDYQDAPYADLYLKRLKEVLTSDRGADGVARGFVVTATAARYLALWMSYEDTIRVADLKTRRRRFERFRAEVQAEPAQVVYVTEFMHPRYEELCETLPARLGRWLQGSSRARQLLAGWFKEGRHVNTVKLSGFLPLFGLAALRRWRRGTLRYQIEQERIEDWLERLRSSMDNYDLATEIAECPRLIKGYGDTHQRGLKSYGAILHLIDRDRRRADVAARVRRTRAAALADENGAALDSTLRDLSA
jgi:indolepyruvate ferredoxin oxidoreductase beta subunit